ncbi:MAG: selenocysteine-specific translation elongation factor [Chitinispirillaceae bacterium]|nr:selenocysteine-specific translation elongation factor [Chitinispirillaceae bacterium]
MKHLILGTAGHVDHGKTALVKALTGIDCDTHKEEKQRGITINLGFAHIALASGDTIGIIDVPGHRDFIHTMVSGAMGIDLALLVIAADSGIMPQTREHVRIMDLLGIRTGVVALTRIDLAPPDVVALCAEETVEFVAGTFLEGCPIVQVSAVTGEGLAPLREALSAVAAAASERPVGALFRMYIDRIFTVSGFGTVVNGSVLGGSITAGSTAFLMPYGREVRIRRIERYGAAADEVRAGDRASLNVAGLSRDEFERGMMIASRQLRTTNLIDGHLELFEGNTKRGLWSTALFLMGTFEAQVRIHLLDCDSLAPGNRALTQVQFPVSCVAQYGDRFVLRSTSGDRTIGGGVVIDAAPLHHRRRTADLKIRLQRLVSGSRGELITAEVRKSSLGVSLVRLADRLNLTPEELVDEIPALPAEVTVVRIGQEKACYFVLKEAVDLLELRVQKILEAHHRDHPLLATGKTVEELRGAVGIRNRGDEELLLKYMLEQLRQRGVLKQVGYSWVLASHAVVISKELEGRIASVENDLKEDGIHLFSLADLSSRAAKRGIDERTLRQIVHHLIGRGRAYAIEGNFIDGALVDTFRAQLLKALGEAPQGLTVAQFRDLIAANRKVALSLFSLFESEGIIQRTGDVRILTDRGREKAAMPG